jgi:hypothetical protein
VTIQGNGMIITIVPTKHLESRGKKTTNVVMLCYRMVSSMKRISYLLQNYNCFL